MWELRNKTRFAADRSFARDRDGAEVLLVVVKATFTIAADKGLVVADRQAPALLTPQYAGDPTSSGLVYDGDFALTKSATDILLLGHAHAARGEPAIAVEARIRVGAFEKRLLAIGNRYWKKHLAGWALSEPEPFVSMPLGYERAFGGSDDSREPAVRYDDNPIGIGFALSSQETELGDHHPAPNLEDPEALMQHPYATPRPMSFSPIPREWLPRRRLAGTYDEAWKRRKRPLVPDDFDDAFWQSAPPDQRHRLSGGEEVELHGVSPRGALRFNLPRLDFAFRSRLGEQTVEHAGSLHTVLFEPDLDRVVMVYASALPCHHTIQSLKRTVVTEMGSAA